ncbi:sensor histidine kinase [Pararhodonellum marinum]|uniref:sensor histidine kinase n=1 Tax=Pararhodonellum marinum TaxID=2755358 RepID=UPI001E4C81B7|nr:histidine kinase [Pararhodonellum marinum]
MAILLILLWIMGVAYLLVHYGQPYQIALTDATLSSSFLFFGFFVLENIFRYYAPRLKNVLVFLIFPTLIMLLIQGISLWTLNWYFKDLPGYDQFLNQTAWLRGFIVFLVLLGYSLIHIVHGKLEQQMQSVEREKQLERMAKESELHQLRQQLQPHFLFNSLNSISSLVKRQPDAAREMIIQLSDFLRKTIRKEDKSWISVSEEVEYLGLFATIEKIRFGHRLTVAFEVPDEVKEAKMPQLLVQPLLENAIKHGLYGTLEEVCIRVIFEGNPSYLKVKVENPYDGTAGQPKGEGFGLEVIGRRLYLLFGRNDLLQLDIQKDSFTAEIKIPKQYEESTHH